MLQFTSHAFFEFQAKEAAPDGDVKPIIGYCGAVGRYAFQVVGRRYERLRSICKDVQAFIAGQEGADSVSGILRQTVTPLPCR